MTTRSTSFRFASAAQSRRESTVADAVKMGGSACPNARPGLPGSLSGLPRRLRPTAAALLCAVITACGSSTLPAESSTSIEPRGALECDGATFRTAQGIAAPGARGADTAEEELRSFLGRWSKRAGGVIAIVDETTGSLIIDDREQAVAVATEAPAGGWVVLTSRFCEGIPGP